MVAVHHHHAVRTVNPRWELNQVMVVPVAVVTMAQQVRMLHARRVPQVHIVHHHRPRHYRAVIIAHQPLVQRHQMVVSVIMACMVMMAQTAAVPYVTVVRIVSMARAVHVQRVITVRTQAARQSRVVAARRPWP